MDKCTMAILGCAVSLASAPAWTHGEASSKSKSPAMVETSFGKTGEAHHVNRTIVVQMSDRMRFMPSTIKVTQGETIHFDVRNSGQVLHEMVLGTMDELKHHAELMRKFPGMEHDEPYQAHVPPGKRIDMIWQFTNAGNYLYGCLVPGHFEAGMVGRIEVVPRPK